MIIIITGDVPAGLGVPQASQADCTLLMVTSDPETAWTESLSKTGCVGGAGLPQGAANPGCGQCPWSSGIPCTEREMSDEVPLASITQEEGMEVGPPGDALQQRPSPHLQGRWLSPCGAWPLISAGQNSAL